MTYRELESNYTQIPNPILDALGEMSESELKLTMCLVRYTFGYHEEKAQMTYEIMQERTGMSRGAVYRAIELVEKRGFFRRGRRSFWFVNSSEFELCYVKGLGKGSNSERKSAGKSSKSEPTKRKSKKNTTAAACAMEFYQNNIGGIGRDLTIKIKTAVQMHTEQTVLDAMQEAVDNNVLKWNYVDAILRNWEENGRVKPALNGHKSNGAVLNDAAIWDTVLQHARRGDSKFSDPVVTTAVRAFGWPKLQNIKPGDENFHRKEFLRIYHEQSTAATP